MPGSTAFRAILMGFGNVRSFVRHENSSSNISKTVFNLESQNFMGTSILTLSRAIPDMTSLSTPSRRQIAQTCELWAIFASGRDFSVMVQPILKRLTVLETAKRYTALPEMQIFFN